MTRTCSQHRLILSCVAVLSITSPPPAFAQSVPTAASPSQSPPSDVPPSAPPQSPRVESPESPMPPWVSDAPSGAPQFDAMELRRIHRVLRWGADREVADRGVAMGAQLLISLGYTVGGLAQIDSARASGSTSNGLWAAPMFTFSVVYLGLGVLWSLRGPIDGLARTYDDALATGPAQARVLVPRLRPALNLAAATVRSSSTVLLVTSGFAIAAAGGYFALMIAVPSVGDGLVGWGISFATMGVASLTAGLTLRLRDTATRTREALDSGFTPPEPTPSPLLVPTVQRSQLGTMVYGLGVVF